MQKITQKRSNITLAPQIKEKCDAYYEKNGVNLSSLVAIALIDFFSRNKIDEPNAKKKGKKVWKEPKIENCKTCFLPYDLDANDICPNCKGEDIYGTSII